jgi:uncharacterized protein involved in type VI secretion and phage assembly
MGRSYGVVVGTVVDVNDLEGQGRVLVRYPWMRGKNQGYWAPVSTLMAGGGRGAWFMPEKDDEVLVAFEQGDVSHPFILGFLWNGQDKPPTTNPHLRVIRSVNGHEIRFYDPPVQDKDEGYIRIQYARSDGTMNIVELANGGITISSDTAVQINSKSVSINGRLVLPAPKHI